MEALRPRELLQARAADGELRAAVAPHGAVLRAGDAKVLEHRGPPGGTSALCLRAPNLRLWSFGGSGTLYVIQKSQSDALSRVYKLSQKPIQSF